MPDMVFSVGLPEWGYFIGFIRTTCHNLVEITCLNIHYNILWYRIELILASTYCMQAVYERDRWLSWRPKRMWINRYHIWATDHTRRIDVCYNRCSWSLITIFRSRNRRKIANDDDSVSVSCYLSYLNQIIHCVWLREIMSGLIRLTEAIYSIYNWLFSWIYYRTSAECNRLWTLDNTILTVKNNISTNGCVLIYPLESII